MCFQTCTTFETYINHNMLTFISIVGITINRVMSISPVDKYIYIYIYIYFINICNIPYSIIKHLFERNSVYIYMKRFSKNKQKNPSKTSVICFCKLTFPIYIYICWKYIYSCAEFSALYGLQSRDPSEIILIADLICCSKQHFLRWKQLWNYF